MRDWDTAQQNHINKPAAAVNKHHVFTVKDSDPNALIMQEYYGALPTRVLCVKQQYHCVYWPAYDAAIPKELPIPGMPDIKWLELYDKWRHLIPTIYHNDFKYYCINPGPDIRKKLKANAKASKKQKKDQKHSSQQCGGLL